MMTVTEGIFPIFSGTFPQLRDCLFVDRRSYSCPISHPTPTDEGLGMLTHFCEYAVANRTDFHWFSDLKPFPEIETMTRCGFDERVNYWVAILAEIQNRTSEVSTRNQFRNTGERFI